MNAYEEARNAWARFAEEATRAAEEAKTAGELAVAEHRLEDAVEAFGRWRTIAERVLPELERARTRALVYNPRVLPQPPRRG